MALTSIWQLHPCTSVVVHNYTQQTCLRQQVGFPRTLAHDHVVARILVQVAIHVMLHV